MKRVAVWLCLAVLLAGCAGTESELDRGMALRRKLLAASGCSFDAEVTADYGDKLYTFSAQCQGDSHGNLEFRVTSPENISGIAGRISGDGGKFTFDDVALHFPLLADGQLSPVSAPWIFLKTLRGGYITSAGTDGELLRLSVDDSYQDDALRLDIWLDREELPVRAEILWQGRKFLTLDVKNFQIL